MREATLEQVRTQRQTRPVIRASARQLPPNASHWASRPGGEAVLSGAVIPGESALGGGLDRSIPQRRYATVCQLFHCSFAEPTVSLESK